MLIAPLPNTVLDPEASRCPGGQTHRIQLNDLCSFEVHMFPLWRPLGPARALGTIEALVVLLSAGGTDARA